MFIILLIRKRVPDTPDVVVVRRVVPIEIAIVEVQFATFATIAIVHRTAPVVIGDERCSCHL